MGKHKDVSDSDTSQIVMGLNDSVMLWAMSYWKTLGPGIYVVSLRDIPLSWSLWQR